MTVEYKVISIHLFRPADKSVKQRCEVLMCKQSEQCDLYKQGKCACKNYILGVLRCPHGFIQKEVGYTNKAKSYYSWFDKKKKEYGEELVDKIEYFDNKMVIVGGDYVFLPYDYLSTYVNKIEGIIREHFILLEDFNVDKIKEILDFEPMSLFGYETISSYQEKEVPRFLQHLHETIPTLFNDFIEKYPEYKEKISTHISNFIGRIAYIKTINQGSELFDCHGNKWIISGNKLICDKWKTWLPFSNDIGVRTEIEIGENMTYKITDNEQVTKDTVFID